MSVFRQPFFLFSVLFSAVLYGLTAYTNDVYFHPDEFFQIVEFASYKLGITPLATLPWEFAEKIRPAFQPLLCYSIFSGLNGIGITDHYSQLFFLRLLTACFSLGAITLFCIANLPYFQPPYQRWYVWCTFLFWLPYYYGVRFSSETWSGNFVLLAVALVVLYQQGRLTWGSTRVLGLVGLICGLAFLFRFQVAFYIVGLALYLLFIRKEKFTALLAFATGGICMVGLGVLADHWLYGEWVFSPWLYFQSNLIKGVASHFGTLPFYMYLQWILLLPSPVIGILILVSLGVLVLKLPKNIYTWVLVPFLLGHSLIGHKELRFIFPVFNFLPVVVMLAYQALNEQNNFSLSNWNKVLRGTVLSLIVIPNFLMLLFLVLLVNVFSTCPKTFDCQVHREWKGKPVQIAYTNTGAHPYIVPKAVIKHDLFPEYLRDSIIDVQLSTYCGIDSLMRKDNVLIATTQFDMENDNCLKLTKGSYEINAHSFPLWVMELPLEKYIGADLKRELDRNVYYLLRVKP